MDSDPGDKHRMDELIRDENRRMRRLRVVVDLAQAVLMQSDLSLAEAYSLVENTKRAAMTLFPGKEDVFDLIYAPRFRRIINERFRIAGTGSGMN